VCSLASRHRQLNQLLSILEPQTVGQPVEIIIEKDAGQAKIGTKRNILLMKASKKYLAFVDDDDRVDPAYVSLILNAIKTGKEPDCIGMIGVMVGGRYDGWKFRHSITVTRWCKDKHARLFFRTPNHLNPIKSELARRVRFPAENYGEDKSYSDQIRPYLKTEAFIEHPIYHYCFNNK
jgi:glycosyltransferase involved in cell wall biosynthesis